MSVVNKRWKVTYGLSIGTGHRWPRMTLNGVKSSYFALFHQIRSLCRPITSLQWLKIDL